MLPAELWEQVRAALPEAAKVRARLLLGPTTVDIKELHRYIIQEGHRLAADQDNHCLLPAVWALPGRRHLFVVAFMNHRVGQLNAIRKLAPHSQLTEWVSGLLQHRFLHQNPGMRLSLQQCVESWGWTVGDLDQKALSTVRWMDRKEWVTWLHQLLQIKE